MQPTASDREHFAHLVSALRPYLEDLVFIGGWLQELYLLHPNASKPDFQVLRTKDADIALPDRLPPSQVSIDQLLREAGFLPELRGDRRPPVTHYMLNHAGGFYAEFLSHRTGSSTARDGAPRDTVEIGGVTTQRLPHIDLLRQRPWQVVLRRAMGYPVDEPGLAIRIANPACYMAQKLLVLDRRPSLRERGKDILYVHDTILMFSEALDELRAIWSGVVGSEANATTRRLHANVSRVVRYLSTVNDDIREAANIAKSLGRGGGTQPETILAVCKQGLGVVFRE